MFLILILFNLYSGKNGLSGSLVSEIGELDVLERLTFKSNNLVSNIPESLWERLPNLSEFFKINHLTLIFLLYLINFVVHNIRVYQFTIKFSDWYYSNESRSPFFVRYVAIKSHFHIMYKYLL